jgi:hypothetical protein
MKKSTFKYVQGKPGERMRTRRREAIVTPALSSIGVRSA